MKQKRSRKIKTGPAILTLKLGNFLPQKKKYIATKLCN